MSVHASKPTIYSIDYGTSNSLLCGSNPLEHFPLVPLDPFAPDPTILRSLIFTPTPNNWFFGHHAIQKYEEFSAEGRFLRSIKKFLPQLSFSGTTIHNQNFDLPALIGVFLREMRNRANQYYDTDVDRVVMGRPAIFSMDPKEDQLAQNRLEKACNLAGFKEVHFLPEPLACAYEFAHVLTSPKLVLIVDLGGGTSDFSIVELGKEKFEKNDVKSIFGLNLAGDAFDGQIMNDEISPYFGKGIQYNLPMNDQILTLPKHIFNKLNKAHEIPLLAQKDIALLLSHAQMWMINEEDNLKMQRLFILTEDHLGYKIYNSIEESKKQFSDETFANFEFNYPGIEIKKMLSREHFEEYSYPLYEKIMNSLKETINQANISKEQIDLVCITGGCSKLRLIEEGLIKMFGKEKISTYQYFHAVIRGLQKKALEIL